MPSTSLTEADIRRALARVQDPDASFDGDIVAKGRLQGIVMRDGNIGVTLDIAGIANDAMKPLQNAVEKAVRDVAGVLSVTVVMTAEKSGSAPQGANASSSTASPEAPNSGPQKEVAAFETPAIFSRIKSVIAVASGKGGVGKSTVAANLALALSRTGASVGLLDADIYGPSLPSLFNVTEKPEVTDNKKLRPIECAGIATMSIGYMIPPDQAMIWRGPMVQAALLQLVNDVDWPELDILVIDMPPGTGDIQLTMAQRFPVDGAIIVTTPHVLALADVRRAMAMFQRVNTPVLGLVENMAYMQLENGEEIAPFGTLDLANDPQLAQLVSLARLPLDPHLQQAIAAGGTIFDNDGAENANHVLSQAFQDLSEATRKALADQST